MEARFGKEAFKSLRVRLGFDKHHLTTGETENTQRGRSFLFYSLATLALVRRGMSVLLADTPGVGEAIRFRGIYLRHDYEVAGSAILDWLEKRKDVNARRAAIFASSLGGYYAPRTAAMEPRFKAAVAWGAQWDYHAIWKRRIEAAYKILRAVIISTARAEETEAVDIDRVRAGVDSAVETVSRINDLITKARTIKNSSINIEDIALDVKNELEIRLAEILDMIKGKYDSR